MMEWNVPTCTRRNWSSDITLLSFFLMSFAAIRVNDIIKTFPVLYSVSIRLVRSRIVVVFPLPARAIPTTFWSNGASIRTCCSELNFVI